MEKDCIWHPDKEREDRDRRGRTREQQRTIVRKERISLARSSKRQEVAVVKEYIS